MIFKRRGKRRFQLLEGSIKGKIDMGKHNFIIGSKGRFEGEISAQNLGVSGQLVGNVKIQEKVKFTKEADFFGNIKAKLIFDSRFLK